MTDPSMFIPNILLSGVSNLTLILGNILYYESASHFSVYVSYVTDSGWDKLRLVFGIDAAVQVKNVGCC